MNNSFKSPMGKRRQHCTGKEFAGIRKPWLALAVFFWIGICGLASAQAATLCVDPLGVPAPGAGECYALPSQAVAAGSPAGGDTILIHAGTYLEPSTITIDKPNMKIIGDDPRSTMIQSTVGSVIDLLGNSDGAEIANLTITGSSENGIGVGEGSLGTSIHHNDVRNNTGIGIVYFNLTGCCPATSAVIFDNVVRDNGGYGISSLSNFAVYNNVVAGNGSIGIYGGSANYNSSYSNGTTGTSNYGSVTGNIGNISTDCLFVDAAANDLRLQAGSACRDTGNPGYLDVDGTVSDMGIFGGPASALFWPYGDGGPVVTGLTVTPSQVPEGGTLSIKATVEIR